MASYSDYFVQHFRFGLQHLHLWLYRKQFSRAKQLRFLEVLFDLQDDGIPLRDSLLWIEQNSTDSVMGLVASHMRKGFLAGQSFATTMHHWFPRTIVQSIKIAEHSNRFEYQCRQILELLKTNQQHTGIFWQKLAAPIGYLALVMALYAYLAMYYFQALSDLVPASQWSTTAQLVHLTGLAIFYSWPWLVAGTLIVFFSIPLILQYWSGNIRGSLDRWMPLKIYCHWCAAFNLEQLGRMANAGLTLKESLLVLYDSETPHSRHYIEVMLQRLNEGYNTATVMDIGYFDASNINLLRLLVKHSDPGECLLKLGSQARKQAQNQVLQLTLSLQILLYSLLALLFIGYVSVIMETPV